MNKKRNIDDMVFEVMKIYDILIRKFNITGDKFYRTIAHRLFDICFNQ